MEQNSALLFNAAKTTVLIAYSPFGLMLCIARFFLAIQTCVILSILPEEFVLSRLIRAITSVLLGMYVKRENFECRQVNTRVFVAYRDTNLAHIAARISLPVLILHTKQLMMGWLFGQVTCTGSTTLRYEGEKILNKRIEVRPLLSISANNKSFRFDEWSFFLHQPIHPMSITTFNPFIPSYANLPSSSFFDLFFLFFFPLTIVSVRMYPSMRREQQEMTQEFRRRVEEYLQNAVTNPTDTALTRRREIPTRQLTRQATLPSSKNDRDQVLSERKQALTTANLRKFNDKYGGANISS